jgi:UDP-2,4-diacetamido-2,4,6-trideoxy-beta-L-altropyranose hydrolase
MNFKIFIITEGSSNIGFGHITRMLSIYQAFEERGIKAKFIINGDDSIKELLKNTDYEIYSWVDNQEKLLKDIKNADIAIIDSYLADKDLYEKISKVVKIPVYYDDNNRLEYPCGIVINGNIYAKNLNYPEKKCIKYLLGTEYLPLRKEFWEVSEKDIKDEVKDIMITFGGDDLRNLTPKVIKLLNENYPDFNKYVVIGKGFRNIKEIQKIADKNTILIFNADAKEMKEIMLKSDIAISAGGQTTYELARVGVPSIIIAVAENQLRNCKGWEEVGFAEYAGWWEDKEIFNKILEGIENLKDKNIRILKSKLGRSFVDGQGARRLMDELTSKNK